VGLTTGAVGRTIGPAGAMHDHECVPAPPAAPLTVPVPGDDAPGRPSATSWRRTILRAPVAPETGRACLYLLLGAPLAAASFLALVAVTWTLLVLSALLIGIPLMALVILAAREYAVVPRALANGLLDEDIGTPRRRQRTSRGLWGWLRASFGDVDAWRAIAYIVVSFPVMVVGAYVTVVAGAVAMIAATYPLWWAAFDPLNTDAQGRTRHSGVQFGELYFDTVPRALALSVVGIAALFVVPWIARLFAAAGGLLARGLLGPTSLSERVDDLEVTRAHVVDDSAATLRRIERDLHDGTQARLVALAMHLDMAKEALSSDDAGTPADDATAADGGALTEPDIARTRELLDQAHRNATEAIAELREVTRSIHPPALDRGLDEALATLAARSGVPARVETRLTARPSPAIETIAYYCVAELLTNVAKHSGARHARIEVDGDEGSLRIGVRDDGRGGARLVDRGGLAGLAERVRSVDGHVTLSSPAGGPTVAVVYLPLGV
jgi:signal transduction histidine kinase